MNILEAIGSTSLVCLRKVVPANGANVLLKLESENPTGSVKDRMALAVISRAEQDGRLKAGDSVLEYTGGSTGTSLALVCAAKGYRCMLVMPESASIERRKIMQAYGAEILLTPASRATDGAIEKSYLMIREFPDRYFLTDQYNNEANWRAHYRHTAPEIWGQTDGKVTHVVATLGTSGTVMGLSAWFHEFQPQVKVVAVEPHLDHKIQGLKNMKESYKPGIFDKSVNELI